MNWVEAHIKQPVARMLFRLGVRANALTLFGLLPCTVAALLLVMTGEVFPVGVLFLVASLSDLFDGALARLEGESHDSVFGAWLDTCVDRISEIMMLIGISAFFGSQHNQFGQHLAVFAIVTGFFVTYVKAAAGENRVAVDWKETEIHVLGRPGRVAILCIGMLITPFVGLSSEEVLYIALFALNALNVPVIVYRSAKVYRATIGRPQKVVF